METRVIPAEPTNRNLIDIVVNQEGRPEVHIKVQDDAACVTIVSKTGQLLIHQPLDGLLTEKAIETAIGMDVPSGWTARQMPDSPDAIIAMPTKPTR